MNTITLILTIFLLTCPGVEKGKPAPDSPPRAEWIDRPQAEWPQIAMINRITYTDKLHEVAGCGFLLDTGREVLAVTAKHILTYFKAESMEAADFGDALEEWVMHPKDSAKDRVVVDELINADPAEPIDSVSAERDWLLFTVKERSEKIQPLEIRTKPLFPGEKVYILGWRYCDEDCTQRIHEGRYISAKKGGFLVSTITLADNKIPGISGGPVIDSDGHLIGLMCKKSGKMEFPTGTDYPREILKARYARIDAEKVGKKVEKAATFAETTAPDKIAN